MYEAFYGLREKPFSLLPDPAFLYFSRKHQLTLTMLEYGLTNQAGFTVISGGIGTGKTTLIRHLLNNMEQDTTVGLISNTHRSFGDLLQWVLLAYDLDYRDKDQVGMYRAFVDFMIREYAEKRRTILIVDEAQNMAPETLEELRMLSNVNADKDQVLQVILVGQQELRDTLRRPELVQFAQRISVDYHLTALDAEETVAYIAHRLQVAGGPPNLFEHEASAAVHRYSGGVPRLINLLCDTALVYGFAEQRETIDARLVDDVARDKQQGGIFPGLGPADAAPESEKAVTDQASAPPDVSSADHPQPVSVPAESEPDRSSRNGFQVAIASESEPLRRHLKEQLELNGLDVTHELPLDDGVIKRLDPDAIDALVVDLDEDSLLSMNDPARDGDPQLDGLFGRLARWDLPIIFNSSEATRASLEGNNPGFGRRLATQLESLLATTPDESVSPSVHY
jgi:type II secretory pathway predicted ATPase ExeA